MSIEQFNIYFTLVVVVVMVFVLVLDRFKPSFVFLSTSALLLLAKIVPIKVFLAGLSNTSILSILRPN